MKGVFHVGFQNERQYVYYIHKGIATHYQWPQI